MINPKQFKFSLNVSLLIQFAYSKGYTISLGDAYAKDGHKKDSLHYDRLAIDLNLFKNGRYIEDSEGHKGLGKFWKLLHPLNRHGGDFKSKDWNHYSMEHNGRM